MLWSWYKSPLDRKQQKYFFFGVSFVTLITLIIRLGWHDLDWFQNPVKTLATIVSGPVIGSEVSAIRWITGTLLLLVLTIVVIKQYRILWADFTGRTLLIALALGATNSDPAWAFIALAIVLYFGFPLLLDAHHSVTGGFVGQRGPAIFLIILLSTLSMRADKTHYEVRQLGILSEQDQLIRTLSEETENARKTDDDSGGNSPAVKIRVASQWPSRTMIVCRCDTFPLPPAATDPPSQLSMLHSITFLLFDPQEPANKQLARNLSVLGGGFSETVALQPGGVLMHFKNTDTVNPGK
ncbi:MAG: hypothetical protein WDM70_04690 [Nitrosomonadales bacterium]